LSLLPLWLEFKGFSVPTDAPKAQEKDMRKAFYAGAFSVLTVMLHVIGSRAMSEKKGVEILERMYKECEEVANAV
jgi:hypothetical protein